MNRSGVRFSKVAPIGPVNRNHSCSQGRQRFLEGDAIGTVKFHREHCMCSVHSKAALHIAELCRHHIRHERWSRSVAIRKCDCSTRTVEHSLNLHHRSALQYFFELAVVCGYLDLELVVEHNNREHDRSVDLTQLPQRKPGEKTIN